MLFSVIGTPSALGFSGCSLIRMIADAAFGSHAFIHASSPDDIKKVWSNIDFSVTKAVVLYSDLPSKALSELLVSTKAPTVIFSDDYQAIVEFLTQVQNRQTMEALRIASQAICSVCFISLVSEPNVLPVTSAEHKRKLEDTILNICEFYSIEDPPKIAASIIKHASMARQSTFADFVSQQQPSPFTGTDNARVDDLVFPVEFILHEYAKIGVSKPNPEISWPTALFLDAARPGENIKGPIDLLGPSRFLIYGPYMHLPAGDWHVFVAIEVSENKSRNRLLVDVASFGCVLTGVRTQLPESGLFKFHIRCRIEDPFLPVEVRFIMLEGAIEGRLWLRQVVFYPMQQGDALDHDDFESTPKTIKHDLVS